VVHARLAISGRVDGVTLTKLDLVQSPELVELPANEGIVERVGIRGDKGATEVDLVTNLLGIGLEKRKRRMEGHEPLAQVSS
jgi:hypothetical protein